MHRMPRLPNRPLYLPSCAPAAGVCGTAQAFLLARYPNKPHTAGRRSGLLHQSLFSHISMPFAGHWDNPRTQNNTPRKASHWRGHSLFRTGLPAAEHYLQSLPSGTLLLRPCLLLPAASCSAAFAFSSICSAGSTSCTSGTTSSWNKPESSAERRLNSISIVRS